MIDTTIRQAVFKAIEHIENDPSRYSFFVPSIPEHPQQCGCLLGWIGYFLGHDRIKAHPTVRKSEANLLQSVARVLGYEDDFTFYATMQRDHDQPNRCELFHLRDATSFQPLYTWAETL